MDELFERWAKLEPDKCQHVDKYYHLLFGRWTIWPLLGAIPGMMDDIEWSVHKAISQHAWNYAQMRHYNEYTVTIYGEWGRYSHTASSMVEALIAAYLDALEAERAGDEKFVREMEEEYRRQHGQSG